MTRVTAAELRHYLDYDAATGIFTWRNPTSNRVRPGDICSYKTTPGYIAVRLHGRLEMCHRLAWLYVHGRWPVAEIDHVDGDRTNNAIANLRECTRQQNLRNMGMREKQNSSGFKGVHWCSRLKKWTVAITVDRKAKYLGCFSDPATAASVYDDAARDRFGAFAKTNASMGLL